MGADDHEVAANEDEVAADDEPGVDGLLPMPATCDDTLFIDSAAVDL